MERSQAVKVTPPGRGTCNLKADFRLSGRLGCGDGGCPPQRHTSHAGPDFHRIWMGTTRNSPAPELHQVGSRLLLTSLLNAEL